MSGFVRGNAATPDIWGLLNLMADPIGYKAKLVEIQEIEDRLDAKVALAGAADEIVSLREVAAANHELAIKALSEAEKKGTEMLTATQERIERQNAECQSKIAADYKLAQERLDAIRVAGQEIIDQANLYAQQEKEKADLTEAALEQLRVDLSQKISYYTTLTNNLEIALTQAKAERDMAEKLRADAQADRDAAQEELVTCKLQAETFWDGVQNLRDLHLVQKT